MDEKLKALKEALIQTILTNFERYNKSTHYQDFDEAESSANTCIGVLWDAGYKVKVERDEAYNYKAIIVDNQKYMVPSDKTN